MVLDRTFYTGKQDPFFFLSGIKLPFGKFYVLSLDQKYTTG